MDVLRPYAGDECRSLLYMSYGEQNPIAIRFLRTY